MTNGVTGPKFGMATTYQGKATTTAPGSKLRDEHKGALEYWLANDLEEHAGSDAKQAARRAKALADAGIPAMVVPVPDGNPLTIAEAFPDHLSTTTASGRIFSHLKDWKVQPNDLYVVDGDHMKAIQTARASAEQQIEAEKAMASFKDKDAITAAINKIREDLAKTVKDICTSFLKK